MMKKITALDYYRHLFHRGLSMALGLSLFYSYAIAAESETFSYRASLEGQPIGKVTRQVKEQTHSRTLSEHTQLQAPAGSTSWQYRSDMIVMRDINGLIRYELAFHLNDTQVLHTCLRQQSELWCSANTVLSTQEKNDQTAEQIIDSVLLNVIPYASEATAVLSLFADDTAQKTSLRLPLSEVDTTAAELPNYLWQHVTTIDKAATTPFRLLSIEDLQLVETRATRQADEVCQTPTGTANCRVYTVTDETGSSRWWLYRADQFSNAIIPLQVNYQDSDGSFTLQLVD